MPTAKKDDLHLISPLTTQEVRELLTSTIHGTIPDITIKRVFATLAEWLPHEEQRLRDRNARLSDL